MSEYGSDSLSFSFPEFGLLISCDGLIHGILRSGVGDHSVRAQGAVRNLAFFHEAIGLSQRLAVRNI